MEELRSFAEAIRGHERRGLVRATSAVSIETGGFGVMQMHPSACTQVAAMIVRAEADPAFAWRLTATLDTLGPRANRSANDGDAEATQRELANGRYGVGLLSVPLALMGSEPNRGYVRRGPATPSADYMRQRMVELASSGVDVPIGVETVPGGDGHAMVVTDARMEGGEAILKITDPSGGVSRWVPAGALDDFQIGMGRVRLRAWMDSARGTRDTVTTDADGQPVATRDLFEPL